MTALLKRSNALHPHYCLLDLETAPDPNAEPLLRPVRADSRLKDEAKIAADLKAKTEAQHAAMALDPWAARIVVAAWWTEKMVEPSVVVSRDAQDERELLITLYDQIASHWPKRVIVGYNIYGFDLPVLVTRSRILTGPRWKLDLRRFGSEHYVDLQRELLLDNDPRWEQGVVSRSMTSLASRLGLPVADNDITGADVPRLAAEGHYDLIATHARHDIKLVREIAERLGLIDRAPTQDELHRMELSHHPF